MADNVLDLTGVSTTSFTLGPLATGVRLKNNSGNLTIRNNGDSADATLTTSQLLVSGNNLILNSDAAGAGADWTFTLARPASGMTADLTITLPVDNGTSGQVLSTDGSGNTSWVSSGSTSQCVTVEQTDLNFGDSSPVTAFTLPANAIVDSVQVVIDTPFDGTAPQLTVGVNGGSASKFMIAGANNLKGSATSVYTATSCVGVPTSGSTQAVELYYTADSSAAGAARVLVKYYVPL